MQGDTAAFTVGLVAVAVVWLFSLVVARMDGERTGYARGEAAAAKRQREAVANITPPDFAELFGRRTFVTRCTVCGDKHDMHCEGCGCRLGGGCHRPTTFAERATKGDDDAG